MTADVARNQAATEALRLKDGGPCWAWGCEGRIVVARIMRWCTVCKRTGLA